ncbi:hypothetical protein [Burkholderia gladioli]|uniref:hypothetical protein n=1 Tax=Burkholderia gladioli TaxID=28095 RepID=UPI0016406F2B|nr:hypothetical protein [Burkholderia gladioli]
MTTERTGAALGDGCDDLTPYLIDLARTMEQTTAPTVAPVPVPENSGTHPTEEPADPIRVTPSSGIPPSRTTARSQVRFTLTITGSADPLAIGVFLSLLAVLVTMVAV